MTFKTFFSTVTLLVALIQGVGFARAYTGAAFHSVPVRQVQTSGQFVEVMELHRQRVRILALAILKDHPERFPGLRPEQVARYIDEIHDAGKLKPEMAEDLFRYWGVRIGSLPEPEKSRGLGVVQKLNREETSAEQTFFTKSGWSENIKQECKDIETIADRLDRALAPLSVEEFGGKMTRASAFIQDATSEKYADIFQRYEAADGRRYREITRGHHFTASPPVSIAGASAHGCAFRVLSQRLLEHESMLDYLVQARAAGRISAEREAALRDAVQQDSLTMDELRNQVFRGTNIPARVRNNGSAGGPDSLEAASRMRKYETYVELPNGQRKLIQEVGSEDAWTTNGAAYLKSYPRGTKLIRRDRSSGRTTTLETRP